MRTRADSQAIETALWNRENSPNIAVGMNVAMPHAKIATIDRTYLRIFINNKPIGYGAPDGEKADVYFATLGLPSERNHHMQLLARLSRCVLKTPLLEEFRVTETNDDVLQIIGECDDINLDESHDESPHCERW